ncbi:MAG: lipoprotein [Gammaproteobacteria bacterium]
MRPIANIIGFMNNIKNFLCIAVLLLLSGCGVKGPINLIEIISLI